ncbi:hypothetical protein D1AOALGA4SA_1381 [Olavius algarvensis Delta 1 endosymbiont]|nr:hypothetical protein D1AOALGA4SA_1381 [Olavius algarvensis Delta 1 endosymbiont]
MNSIIFITQNIFNLNKDAIHIFSHFSHFLILVILLLTVNELLKV